MKCASYLAPVSQTARRHVKISVFLLVAVLLAGCADLPEPFSCDFSQTQNETIRFNAGAFLQQKFGDGYFNHGSKWAVTRRVVEVQGRCGVRIVPMDVSTNPDDFLRGEGFVFFNPTTLEPFDVEYFLE